MLGERAAAVGVPKKLRVVKPGLRPLRNRADERRIGHIVVGNPDKKEPSCRLDARSGKPLMVNHRRG